MIMAKFIEFRSNVDGLDIIEISRKRSLHQQLRDIKLAFIRAGYRVFGDIYRDEDRWDGEMVAVGRGEEVRFHIV